MKQNRASSGPYQKKKIEQCIRVQQGYQRKEASVRRARKAIESSSIRCKMKCHGRLWQVKSKGAILSLFLQFCMSTTVFTIGWCVTEASHHTGASDLHIYGTCGLILLGFGVSSPVAGWLADGYFTRHKVIQFGLWVTWVGVMCVILTLLISYTLHNCPRGIQGLCIIGGLLGIALVTVGLSTYLVNSVQFGTDQMPYASAEELSACIHWFVWVTFVGGVVGRLTRSLVFCFAILNDIHIGSVVQLMIPVTLLSLALCCEFILRGWLIVEPGHPNSLRMIYRVLKFAVTHKYPIRRRAITYTEDERPSRIDFAKDKFGGPFTTEQVEDVKTFFRIIVVFVSTAAFFFPLALLIVSYDSLLDNLGHDKCSQVVMVASYSQPTFGVAIIPVHTFILYPFIRNRIPRMLQRVVLAATLTVVISGAILVIDSIEHALNPNIACMFDVDTTHQVLKPSLWWTIPANFTMAVDCALYVSALIEFTCAQSPYAMRGLLSGLMCSITVVSVPAAGGIFTAWKSFKLHISPSCDFYYFLFQFLCAVVGLIILCIVARWYKRRRREEEDDQRRIVEAIYDRLLSTQV